MAPPLYNNQNAGVAGQFDDASAVTPADATTFDPPFKALYIGTSGDVAIRTISGSTVTFKNHPVGYLLCRGDKVMQTNTTASNIVAGF